MNLTIIPKYLSSIIEAVSPQSPYRLLLLFAVYVDADMQCNELEFNLGSNAIGGAAIPAGRGWNIKVTQLACDHPNRAPQGGSTGKLIDHRVA